MRPFVPPDVTAGAAPPNARRIMIPVRFADVDGMRHVNNAKYLTYSEEARTRWAIEDLSAAGLDEITFILARAEVDFLAAARLGDTVQVDMWVPRIGTKSWDFAYVLSRADGTVLARLQTTQVAFDYAAERSIALPDRYRSALRELLPPE